MFAAIPSQLRYYVFILFQVDKNKNTQKKGIETVEFELWSDQIAIAIIIATYDNDVLGV